jgi:beta-glucosidase
MYLMHLWLPDSEGAGVADLLFKDTQGNVQYDFSGRLSFSWPASPLDVEVNLGDEHYQPLFAYGYGLSVYEQQNMPTLSEVVDLYVSQINDNRFLFAGDPVQPWRLVLYDAGGNT